MNKQSLLYTMVFTFLVSFVFVLFLSFAHQTTEPLVEHHRELARQRAVLAAMGIEATGEEEVRGRFADVEQIERDGLVLFRTEVNDRTVYAKEFSGAGLWGPIRGILAVTNDLEQTIGIEITDQNETPGLGGRITERWFKEQFAGQRIVDGTIRMGPPGEGTDSKDDGIVDSVTGATRTSESIGGIVERELRSFADALGESL